MCFKICLTWQVLTKNYLYSPIQKIKYINTDTGCEPQAYLCPNITSFLISFCRFSWYKNIFSSIKFTKLNNKPKENKEKKVIAYINHQFVSNYHFSQQFRIQGSNFSFLPPTPFFATHVESEFSLVINRGWFIKRYTRFVRYALSSLGTVITGTLITSIGMLETINLSHLLTISVLQKEYI